MEIRLELLEDNYKKFIKYNDFLVCVDPQLDVEEQLENDFIRIKLKLKRRLEFLCAINQYDCINGDKTENTIDNSNIMQNGDGLGWCGQF